MSTNIDIHSREEIIAQLQLRYQALIDWYRQQADHRFDFSPETGKWTAGQHADHLIKSTRPVNKALRMPRLMLKSMFGINNREERSYEALKLKYNTALQRSQGVVPPSRFLPPVLSNDQKGKTLIDLQNEVDRLCQVAAKWKEAPLSKYILPHPLIGKLTLREMLFFTIFHTEHHHRILIERYEE